MAERALLIHEHAKHGNLVGLREELAKGVSVDVRNPGNDRTPLMEAAAASRATPEMLRLLVDHGANVNARAVDKQWASMKESFEQIQAFVESRKGAGDPNFEQTKDFLGEMQKISPSFDQSPARDENALSLALHQGNYEKIDLLLNAGADVAYRRAYDYDALIDVMHGRRIIHDPQLVPLVRALVCRGAPLNTVSHYSESALSVASRCGRFDAVRVLLDAGADPAPLQWTPIMHAIALGSLEDVQKAISDNPGGLHDVDFWLRTPWLLSLAVGDVEKSKLLLASGANRSDRGRCGKIPLMYPIVSGHVGMVRWLLAEGFDPDERDDFQGTPLMEAVEAEEVEIVEILIDAGADIECVSHSGTNAIMQASNLETLRMLVNAGADLNAISDEMRAVLTSRSIDDVIAASQAEYAAAKHRRFGNANPEKMNLSFWRSMITSGAIAHAARKHFDDIDARDEAVWCFRRYGKSINLLPDGRIIEIAGEHEDHYDPDFCIYNDVIVHDGRGGFGIYGYPESCFPPTDFHTATHVGAYVYLVGNLGYPRDRKYDDTQVCRLCLATYEIHRLPTTGEKPGWINRHKAVLEEGPSIRISGGNVCRMEHGQELYEENLAQFVLDLKSLVWRKVG